MKNLTTHAGLATLLAVMLLLPGAAALAQEMTFTIDPLVVGVLETDVDTDSAKFQEYRDLGSGFHLPVLQIEGLDASADRYFGFRGESVGRDDARYTLDYGVWGSWGLELEYNKIPHRFGNDAALIFGRPGRDRFALPDALQGTIQGAIEKQFAVNRNGVNFAFLSGLVQPVLDAADRVDVALQRDRTAFSFDLGKMSSLAWRLDVEHENRTGTRPMSASFGFNNVVEILEPIDYDTSNAELAGEWNTTDAGLRFGVRYSQFENDVSTVFWDNPFRVTDATDGSAYLAPGSGSIAGSATGFADLAPDNEATTAFAAGRARFGGWNLQGNLGYTVMTQDEPLLPFTLNSAIVGIGFGGEEFDPTSVANLPTRNADTEVEVLNASLDLGTRFAEDFSLDFRVRYYDYDNQSTRIELPGYVRFHAVWEEIPRVTVPYSYTRSDVGVELGWDFASQQHLELAYFLNDWDRDFRETEGTEEDVLSLTYDGRFPGDFDVRARYEIGDRTIDGAYVTAAQGESFLHEEEPNNQPGMRKFLQAAREYDEWNLSAGRLFGDSFDVRVGVTGRDEEYPDSEFGLAESDVLTLSFDASYAPSAGTSFYVFANREDRDHFQRSRQSGGTPSTNPLDSWSLTVDETTDTLGVGFAGEPEGPFGWDLSAFWSRSDGDADFFTPPGGNPSTATDFDDYDDVELLGFVAEATYRLSEAVTAGVLYRYEDYEIDSFQFDGLRNYMPAALLLVPSFGDYTAQVFGINLRFGL